MRQAMHDVADSFLDQVVGRSFGSVTVVRVQSFLDEDNAGELATYLTLFLNDPPGETWPVDDIYGLKRTLRREAREEGLEGPLYFDLRPLTPDVLYEDDEVVAPAGE